MPKKTIELTEHEIQALVLRLDPRTSLLPQSEAGYGLGRRREYITGQDEAVLDRLVGKLQSL